MTVLTDRELAHFPDLADMVLNEGKKQVDKWGIQSRTPFEWLTFLAEEVGELAKAISELEYREGMASDVIKEAIQTATLALKIAEMYLDYPYSLPTSSSGAGRRGL